MMNLSVQLAPKNRAGLRLANPVMTASGTFGYGTEYSHLFDIQKLGAIVCKGTTLKPRDGNPQPRLMETPSGMLNSIGLQNIGVRALVEEMAPIWDAWRVPVIVNVAGESVEEYVGRVVSARIQAVELAVQHVRHPGQRVPVDQVRLTEGPLDALFRKPRLDPLVLRDVERIGPVDERKSERLAVQAE